MCHSVSRTGTTLTRRVIRDAAELVALTDRWRELNDACANPEPMLSPDWLLTWWRHYGQNRTLAVGVYEIDGVLVGLAPMISRIHRYRPGLRFRRLEPLGAEVEEGDGVCSIYSRLLARPGSERAVCEAFVAGVNGGDFGPWDEVLLPCVDAGHPMTSLYVDAWKQIGRPATATAVTESPYAPLPATWDEYLRSITKKRRHTLRQARRNFDEWANGQTSYHRATDETTLREGTAILLKLHRERWSAEGSDGVFASPRFLAFHEEYMAGSLARGELELGWLTVAGRAVAAHYSFRHGNRLSFYQMGRAIDVPADVSVGLILVMEAMADVMSRGVREFDFLGGRCQYKTLFAPRTRSIADIRVIRATVKETIRRCLRWGWHRLRNLRGRRDSTQVPQNSEPDERVNETVRPT